MNILPSKSDGLYTPTIPVENVIAEVHPHLNAMRNLMTKHRGVGLAAPQVGVAFRFFIYGGRKMGGSLGVIPFKVIVNPRIVWKSDDIRGATEGCLSFPGQTKWVYRPESIRINYIDYNPWTCEQSVVENKLVGGYIGRVFQHETDHLDGVCIFERPADPKPADPKPAEPGVLVAETVK